MKGSCKQLPDGRWSVRWRTPDGRQPRRSFQTKKDAERFLRQTLVDQDRGVIGVVSGRQTLGDLIPEWWDTKRTKVKPRTAERYELAKRTIEQDLGHVKLADLNYEIVQHWVNRLSDRYAPRTVSSTYGVLSLILKHAGRLGKVRAIPKPELPRPRRPKLTVPTKDEVEQLAARVDARLYAAVLLCGYCGLREGEVLALHRRDVNLEKGWVFVHQAVNKSTGALEATKTDADRRVYLPARPRAVLAEHLDEYEGQRLFPVSGSYVQKNWERARRSLGLEAIRFHDLRHAAASLMIHAGWSVNMVAQQLGHTDPHITLRTYSHLWPTSFEDAIRRFDEYVGHDALASG